MPVAPHTAWMLIVFLVAVAIVAGVASRFRPGAWYAALRKPPWTPPNRVFGPVWTVLYVLVAVAGWEIFSRAPGTAPKALWIAQLVLNALWSWAFFGRRAVVCALANVLALAGTVAALVVLVHASAPLATWLLAPYLVWILYAASLNAGVAVLNRAVPQGRAAPRGPTSGSA